MPLDLSGLEMNQKIESIGDALQLRALKTCAAFGQVADCADDHRQGITREHRAAQHDGLPTVFASLRHWDLSPESQSTRRENQYHNFTMIRPHEQSMEAITARIKARVEYATL